MERVGYLKKNKQKGDSWNFSILSEGWGKNSKGALGQKGIEEDLKGNGYGLGWKCDQNKILAQL